MAVTNQLISGILEQVAIRKNSKEYCLGSVGIKNQITKLWLDLRSIPARRQSREQNLRVTGRSLRAWRTGS